MISTDPTVWLTAIMMLGVYSYLYKENIYFRFIEHTFVGCSVGFGLIYAIRSIIKTGVKPLMAGNYNLIIAFLLGVCLFMRYFKQYKGLSLLPLNLMIAVGLGIVVQGTISAQIVRQIQSTIFDLTANMNNIIILLLMISGISYFIFSREHKGVLGNVTRVGHYTLMIAFGSSFANYILTRTSVLIAQFQFLIWEWLGLNPL